MAHDEGLKSGLAVISRLFDHRAIVQGNYIVFLKYTTDIDLRLLSAVRALG